MKMSKIKSKRSTIFINPKSKGAIDMDSCPARIQNTIEKTWNILKWRRQTTQGVKHWREIYEISV